MKKLEGKTAIVTGASRGIGAAIAEALARDGANVAINYVGDDSLAEDVAAKCEVHGVRTKLFNRDVSDRASVESMVADVVAEFGQIDIAVSNAAWSERELFYTADVEKFEKTVQICMWGAFYLLRAVTNEMVEKGTQGSIVFVGSTHEWRAIPGSMAYNMSKAAIGQMARTAAVELANKRIRVNVVHPGWVDTPGERKFFSEEKIQENGSKLPFGRLAKAEEIAHGVLFFCDPASEYITGSSVLIDGGICLPFREMHRLETPS